MSSPSKESEEPTSSGLAVDNGHNGPSVSSGSPTASEQPRPPAKRPLSNAVIEISDTESDDSDVCAVTSYQASADEVKRIRGADYSSSSSSSSDYSSDSESPWEDDSIVIPDDNVGKKPIKASLNPRANRMEDPKLNSQFQSQDLIDRLKTHWTENKDLKMDELSLTNDPFRVCLLHNFLSNPDIINNIVDDMNTLDWSRKEMDLYQFHQTADLACLTWQRSIKGIYELLKTDFMTWVSSVTGLELTSVSASCSLYGPGDHLLVHDDMFGDRRVAFILYLAPWQPVRRTTAATVAASGDGDLGAAKENGAAHDDTRERGWLRGMGGALELLARDAAGPTEVVRALCPANNMLAFFRVGCDSYHQVGEVLSMELPRLSINGWFHGPEPPAPEPAPPPAAEEQLESHKPHNEVTVLASWVDAAYLAPRLRAAVQAQMERSSEVCLRALLPAARLAAVTAALGAPQLPWARAGPAHRRRHRLLPADWALQQPDHVLAGLMKLFASAAFVRLLADCTDLALARYERLELQRWSAGDYALLPERGRYASARLEAVLYLGVPERALAGGHTTYVAPEDAAGGAIVTLPPDNNALGLVYCDAGAAAFTKYVSRLALQPHECFYILSCTYRE